MTAAPFGTERQVALDTARRAADYLKANQHRAEIHQTKSGPTDYATAQDLAAEKLIVDTIHETFPTDAVLAEESQVLQAGAERLWIVDPLDGTRNYANGLHHFAVSIAFCHRSIPQVGVLLQWAFPQLRGSRPGRMNASMNVRSKWRPSWLEIRTASDKPSVLRGGSPTVLRSGTNRIGRPMRRLGSR